MNIKRFTYIVGLAFILVGVLGFIPGVTTTPHMNDPALAVETGYGRLLGLFPVNVLHNLVHIALGVWALAVYKNFAQSRIYCKATAIIYGVLMVMGFIPGMSTMFGLVPLHSHDVWLHGVLAVAAAYFGFVRVSDQDQAGMGEPRKTSPVNPSFRWS